MTSGATRTSCILHGDSNHLSLPTPNLLCLQLESRQPLSAGLAEMHLFKSTGPEPRTKDPDPPAQRLGPSHLDTFLPTQRERALHYLGESSKCKMSLSSQTFQKRGPWSACEADIRAVVLWGRVHGSLKAVLPPTHLFWSVECPEMGLQHAKFLLCCRWPLLLP